jgi:hypothetical protein
MGPVCLTRTASSHNYLVPNFVSGKKHLTGVALQYTKKSWKECNTL